MVALSGDGGLAMLLGELITLRQSSLPVKVVVFNNGALSFVELEMKAAGIVNFGTELDNPDFAAIAEAVGLYGARVDKAGRPGRRAAGGVRARRPGAGRRAHRPPGLSLPPKITCGQIKGFTLYATRTILSGRGSEMVELARTNLRDLDAECRWATLEQFLHLCDNDLQLTLLDIPHCRYVCDEQLSHFLGTGRAVPEDTQAVVPNDILEHS